MKINKISYLGYLKSYLTPERKTLFEKIITNRTGHPSWSADRRQVSSGCRFKTV